MTYMSTPFLQNSRGIYRRNPGIAPGSGGTRSPIDVTSVNQPRADRHLDKHPHHTMYRLRENGVQKALEASGVVRTLELGDCEALSLAIGE